MKIGGTGLVDAFVAKNPKAAGVFARWLGTVRSAAWRHPPDVRQTFNHVDFIGGNRAVFDIGGNKYRLVALVVFTGGTLEIRWVGTHAEYDKLKL